VLVIRNAQIEALGQAGLRGFENEMVAHLSEFSPPLAEAAGEEQLRQAIRLGIARAAGHGLNLRGPVRLYLELMLLFGSFFDTDPQYPWAAAILQNPDVQPQMQRADQLFQKILEYRQTVAGPEDSFTFKALQQIRDLARQLPAISASGFVSEMLGQIERVYPQKARYVGTPGLEALIHEGIDRARRAGFSIGRQTALIVVLMLSFGHGCAEDPLYPWIARTLQDPAIVDPPARADRLMRRAVTWLDHVLANYGQAPLA
jgi:hypothetical protein